MKVNLRQYQTEAINKCREYFRRFKNVLLVGPTGCGKTVIFCYIAEKAESIGKRVLILVHRKELLEQTSKHLGELGVRHGLIAPNKCPSGDKLQVASVQTLVRRLGKYPAPDLILVDECHHSAAGSWQKILDYYPNARLLGVTATPVRLDGKALGKAAGGYYEAIVPGPTIKSLIELGYLTQPLVYAPPSLIDLSGVKTRFGDYDKKEINEVMAKPVIVGDAIKHYKNICDGMPAIAFCASVKHAQELADRFCDAGIYSKSIDGKLGDYDRRSRIEGLAQGRIQVLTSCEIVSEGTDIPVVGAAILLRPTQSLGMYLQQVGRVLRPCEGKRFSVILDHVGNSIRHGLPDEIRSWKLNEGITAKKNGESSPKFRQCEKCYFCFGMHLTECPECKHPVEIAERKYDEVDGDLVLSHPDDFYQQMVSDNYKNAVEIGSCKTLGDFKAMANSRGYNPKWAYIRWNLYKKKVGMV